METHTEHTYVLELTARESEILYGILYAADADPVIQDTLTGQEMNVFQSVYRKTVALFPEGAFS